MKCPRCETEHAGHDHSDGAASAVCLSCYADGLAAKDATSAPREQKPRKPRPEVPK